MVTCTACGQENPEGFKFCGACGLPLEDAPSPREERKVVTVLFADLVGFTSRAERMDPEDVRALLAPYHAHLRDVLERWGGTVEKFIGDAVMALFGAPVSYEDDPERALRAALAIHDWASEEGVELRIGINTGEALVTVGAEPLAAGDVVNTAARLQAAAPTGGILVGETTHRATRHVIDYRDAQPVEAKGKAEPVPVWEAVEARSRFGVDVRQHGAAPLIGRDRELAMLVGALERVQEERSPQLVTLVGAPGIGKSRLVYELFGAIERGRTLVFWRQGRSLPYGEGVSFWALAEMVKAQAGIREDDSPDAAGERLAQAVREFVPEREAEWVEAHLRPLAGLGAAQMGLGDRREESFAAWRRFLEAMAERRPLVLVFEDLHWADEGLLDFVDHLVDWASGVPLLVVGTARPELLDRRPAWGGGKLNAATIMLSPLREADTARLVGSLLDQSLLPAETQSALLERAGGNPLYAEQFARLYQERGSVEDLPLPESVHGIVSARLDALPVGEKELLQDAAVMGKVFWAGSLQREREAVRTALHALERKDYVRRERRSSLEEDEEYAFRHLLVRDVAYGQIPRAARAEKHRLAAEWIEALGRPEHHAEMLAHHYVAAVEYSRAAGIDADAVAATAATTVQRAGDRAFGLNAFRNAAHFYDQALELGIAESERPQVLFRLGTALHRDADDRRIEVLDQATEALLAVDDPETAAEACCVLAEAWWHRGNNDRSRQQLERAQELVRGRDPSRAAARVLAEAARYAMLAAEHERAIRVGREALELAEQLGLDELVPLALNNVGVARTNAGDEGGLADLERAIDLGLRQNNPDAARAYNNLAALLAERGEVGRARELWREGSRVAERLGNTTVARYIETQMFWFDYEDGRWDECLAAAEAFIAECEAGSPHYGEAYAHELRADILLARGEAEEATAAVSRCVELARQAKDPQAIQPALATKVKVDLVLGRLDEARRTARELLTYLDRLDTSWGSLRLALAADALDVRDDLASAIARFGDSDRIRDAASVLRDELAEVADSLHERGSLPWEAEVRLRAAELFLSQGRPAEADSQLAQALAFYRSVGATYYIREGEALLAEAS